MTTAPQWSAHVTEEGDTNTVALTGELDLLVADELTQLLITRLDRPGTVRVIADLTAVTFLDSAALGSLIVAYRHAQETGERFTLANPTRPVRRILDISGVYDILTDAA
ncbi:MULTISPECIES: STAS domain-containing protein [Actinoplanes]|uniref:Anti-sigma factor antagonist n=2 Tax=Actinoplanes TaxID=1865 RepID=A0A101JS18_9ACTN|nr:MULTISPECIES: STAS domain-containing protein [Actinoplanes]KUL31980.1 hypothetical protein ADL15_20975 [Actinoplanes awajinensis subsp. mycoplanecinus]GIE70342.1 anti-sigma factor antagonist [Actinoplanes palleronii]